MRNAEYWAERALNEMLMGERSVLEYENALLQAYTIALREIKKDIDAFFTRYVLLQIEEWRQNEVFVIQVDSVYSASAIRRSAYDSHTFSNAIDCKVASLCYCFKNVEMFVGCGDNSRAAYFAKHCHLEVAESNFDGRLFGEMIGVES